MSWNALLEIIQQNRDQIEQERYEPPLVCPIDGTLLDVNARGVRNCKLGNFRWDSGPVIIPQL